MRNPYLRWTAGVPERTGTGARFWLCGPRDALSR